METVEPEQEVIEIHEKRKYYSNESNEESAKEAFLVIPEDNKDDWEEVKASKISNPNNKISTMNEYFIPKDSRRKRGAKGGLLNLSNPESLKSIDMTKTQATANLVQPLVSYYDSFPGVKNYQTELEVVSEQDSQSDIMITEKKSETVMETMPVKGYTYEKLKHPPVFNPEKTKGYVYLSEKKDLKQARSFDSDDYYFYKNEYYKKPVFDPELDLNKEGIEGYLYEGRKKELLLKSHRMINYNYQGVIQEEVNWEVEKRRLKKECKCGGFINFSGERFWKKKHGQQYQEYFDQ